MGPLHNLEHEAFCQAVHALMWVGRKQPDGSFVRLKRADAITEAYVDAVYAGDKCNRHIASMACKANARRLANRPDVEARLKELADFAARLAGCDSGWAMDKLRRLADSVEDFNLDDYLSDPDEDGNRYYDLGEVSRELMGRLSELTIEETAERGRGGKKTDRILRKVKLKGPTKETALPGILSLMADLGGWKAPERKSHELGTDTLAAVLREIDGRSRGLPNSA